MRILKIILALIVFVVISGAGYAFYLVSDSNFENYSFKEYKPQLSTQIYDKNGKLIANIFDKEHRFYVLYPQ